MKNKNIIIFQIHKPKPKHKIISAMQDRWSPRFFSSQKVAEKDLEIIFEAARWTPSAHNHQPWHFFYSHKGEDAHKKIFATLSEHNQLWAGTAPLYIIACAQVINEHGGNPFALYDLGAAVFALVLQAQELGYYSRQMAMFDQEKIKSFLELDKIYQPYIIVAMGKIGNYQKAPEIIIEKELEDKLRKSDIFQNIQDK